MNKEQIIYNQNGIIIKKRSVFGKIGLAGHNKNNNSWVTAIVKDESEIPTRINKMIIELQKEVKRINLTEKLIQAESAYIKSLQD
jgi:hypothetical protein